MIIFILKPASWASILLMVVICTNFETAEGLDFGFSSLVSNFSSGVSGAAKVPVDAISSTYEKLRPSAAENEVKNDTISASTPTAFDTTSRDGGSTSTYRPASSTGQESTTVTSPRTSESYTSTSSSRPTSSSSTRQDSSTTTTSPRTSDSPKRNASSSKDEDDTEATTSSGSWVPDIVKKPFEAVASIPGAVASGAGEAWNTVSETVVNLDPEHSVKFYLYDNPRDLKSYKQIVVGQPDTLRSVKVPEGSRINILIHGFMQDYNSSFPQKMKDTFLQHNGEYVVCVDWGHMADGKFGPDAARTLLYPFIVDNVARVGDYVGQFIVFMKEYNAISNFDQVHVIGFSLGAHVSGIAGWTVQNKTDGEKIARITGLDPAGPKFFLKSKERKLNQDDAKFVDVIHTSHIGYFLSLGHIDFFPNGGKIQPGCVETESTVTDAIASLGSVLTGSCSHSRAWEYYTQSIKDNGLFGCECDNLFKYEITGCEAECEDKVPFGEWTPSKARGNYYLSI